MINNKAYISVLPISPRGFRIAQISPKEDWKLGCFCITKIRLGEISWRKKV